MIPAAFLLPFKLCELKLQIENMLNGNDNFTKTPINCKKVFTLHEVVFQAIQKRDIFSKSNVVQFVLECFIPF